MKGMLDQKDAQSIDAAKLYYNSGFSQAEVAHHLGVSRPTVSKLLSHASARGFVTISIADPREQSDELVGQLRQRFALADVRVTTTPPGGSPLADLGSAGAALMEELIEDGTSVGLSWGETMSAVASHLRRQPREGVEIVQLKGGHSHTERSTKDFYTLQAFAHAFNAEAHLLPLPGIFDSAEAKQWVERDRHIGQILHKGASVSVAVFTVGSAEQESLAFNLGYLTAAEKQQIADNAVGDVCSRFFDARGEVACPAVDARTVGISLADLATRPTRVLVAGGASKARAIWVALRKGLATHLVTDQATARKLVDWASESSHKC